VFGYTARFGQRFQRKLEKIIEGGGVLIIFGRSGILLVVLLGGAWYDLREQRIPNWWCAAACLCGACLTWVWAPEGQKLWQPVFYGIRLLAVVVIWFPLFRLRMIGAGDVKLMALMAGYLGFVTSAHAVLYGFLIGAVLAFLKMLICRNLRQRLSYFFAYIKRLFLTKEALPYYQASRDGKGIVIPMGVCLLGGYMWYLIGMLVK